MSKLQNVMMNREAALVAVKAAEAAERSAVARRDELVAARARGFVTVDRAPAAIDEDDFLAGLLADADDVIAELEATVGRLDAAIVAAEAAVVAADAVACAARLTLGRCDDEVFAATRLAKRKADAAERKAEAAARAARWAARA